MAQADSTRRNRREVLSKLALLAVLLSIPGWSVLRWNHRSNVNDSLISAIKRNDTRAVLAALEAGADPNAQGTSNDPLTLWQSLSEYWDKPADDHVESPALLVALKPHPPSVYHPGTRIPPENVAIIKALLDRGADVKRYGTAALLQALTHGYTTTARLLVERGADINAITYPNDTVLMLAINMNRPDWVTFLIQNGADVNRKAANSWSPLRTAEHDKKSQIVALLKKAGAKE